MEESGYWNDSVSTLGERIGVAREHAGLTEEELAARLAVRRRTVDAWEGDGAEPRANMLTTLAGVLGVSPAWLLSGAGTGVPSPDDEGEDGLDDGALRLRLAAELREAMVAQTRIQQRIARIADALAAID